MCKYSLLWEYVSDCGKEKLCLSFEDIKNISGIEIDHSFLTYKKELLNYGYKVSKISMKNKTVTFEKGTKQ